MVILLISIIILIIGLLLFMKEKRNFLHGVIFALGVFATVIVGSFLLLDYIYNHTQGIGELINTALLILLPLLFIVIVIALMWNTRSMMRREGKSYLALLSFILGVNLIVIIPLPIYLDGALTIKMPTWLFNMFIYMMNCQFNCNRLTVKIS